MSIAASPPIGCGRIVRVTAPRRTDEGGDARRRCRRLARIVALLLLCLGVALGIGSVRLAAKATLAQLLLDRAWAASLGGAAEAGATPAARPWPWADVVPRARLHVAGRQRPLVVLGDASGEALAFGPGLVAGDPVRAARETIVLGGHRDSHLAFVERLPVGATLALETPDGTLHRYRLAEKRIVDGRRESLAVARDAPGLVLITCYPFRATQTGGPLRMVAVALPSEPDPATGADGTRRVDAGDAGARFPSRASS